MVPRAPRSRAEKKPVAEAKPGYNLLWAHSPFPGPAASEQEPAQTQN